MEAFLPLLALAVAAGTRVYFGLQAAKAFDALPEAERNRVVSRMMQYHV